ncbi:MAG: hypothetical protein NZM44_00285 [Candidatus Calescibacterium sp.]|nr:hypothetical protein [Candidatus Calescibacterium sp.]
MYIKNNPKILKLKESITSEIKQLMDFNNYNVIASRPMDTLNISVNAVYIPPSDSVRRNVDFTDAPEFIQATSGTYLFLTFDLARNYLVYFRDMDLNENEHEYVSRKLADIIDEFDLKIHELMSEIGFDPKILSASEMKRKIGGL